MSEKNLVKASDTIMFGETVRVNTESAQQRPQLMHQKPQQMQQPRPWQQREQFAVYKS